MVSGKIIRSPFLKSLFFANRVAFFFGWRFAMKTRECAVLRMTSKKRPLVLVKQFLVEMVVYSALTVGYVFLITSLLDVWLKHLFDDERRAYAFVALALIIGQGIGLQIATTQLLKWIGRRMKR